MPLVWCALLWGTLPLTGPDASPPASDDAGTPWVEGEWVERDGRLFEVRGGVLVPLALDETGAPATQPTRRTDDIAGGARPQRPELPPSEVVLVTASRIQGASATPTGALSVISSDELVERGARTLADALRQEAGIQLNTSVGVGQEVMMDGLDGRHVLVLVDGQPVAGRVNNRVDLSRLGVSAQGVERIEIVRGPMSALHGSEALGGVINIVSRRPSPGVGGGVQLDSVLVPGQVHQAAATGHAHAAVGNFHGRLEMGGLQNWPVDRGGTDATGKVGFTPDGVPDAPARRQANLRAEAGASLHDSVVVRSITSLTSQDAETRFGTATPFRDAVTTRQLTQTLTGRWEVTPRHALEATVRADRFEHRFFKVPLAAQRDASPFCAGRDATGIPTVDQPCRAPLLTRTHTRQSELRGDARYDGHLAADLWDLVGWSVGHAWVAEDVQRTDGTGADTLVGGNQRVTASWYAELMVRPVRALTLQAGVRVDAFVPAAGRRGLDVAPNPKLAARLDLPLGLMVRASYGEGFRLPSLQERFLYFDHSELGYAVVGNPALRAEKSRGVRGEVALAPWAGLRVSAETFINLLENLITETSRGNTTGSGVPVFTYANAARAYTLGTNLLATASLAAGLHADAAVQVLWRAVDASSCPAGSPYFCATATSLPMRAPLAGQFKLRWSPPGTGTTMFWQAGVLSDRPLAQQQTAPASINLGAGIRQRLHHAVEAYATVDNALDNHHPTYGPKPGRALMLGLQAWH